MKIEEKDNNLIVFLNKKSKPNINLSNKIDLEKYFQKLFLKLNNIYDLNLSGNYEINIYNNNYGIILEIKKEENEFFDYYDGIDMRITISKYNDVIYKIKSYNELLKKTCELYIYEGEIYAKPKNDNFQKLGILIENSEIIYGKECFKTQKKIKKIPSNFPNIDKIL